jgi:hypothetical protein
VLCPKTKETFHKDEVYLDVVFMGSITEVTMTSFDPSDRRFIGRYQFCAWMDRAERWASVRCGRYGSYANLNEGVAFAERCLEREEECRQNAEAWREWEKEAS